MPFFKVHVKKSTDYYVGLEAEDVEQAKKLALEADLDEATELDTMLEIGYVEKVRDVKTVEGGYLKEGDTFWSIGVTKGEKGWKYVPFFLSYPADIDDICNDDEVFSTYQAAKKYADERTETEVEG